LDIIKKYRSESNLNIGIQEINKMIIECEPVLNRAGKLLGCAGADDGCKGYPRCFEVATCLGLDTDFCW